MHTSIRKYLALAAALLLAPMAAGAALADAGAKPLNVIVKPNAAKKFATMPDGAAFPEGIAANPFNGDVIVGTFFGAVNLVRFSADGAPLAALTIGGGPLLGLAFNPDDGKVYICSADDLAGGPAGSRIRRIDANFTDDSSLEDVAGVPAIGAPGDRTVTNPDTSVDTIAFGDFARAPNGLTFAGNGDLYYSDSFQGAVFRIGDPAGSCPSPGCVTETIAHDPLLATAGFPPFGANGVALNQSEDTLFVANTGDDRVLTVAVDSGDVGVLAESVNGADGVVFDATRGLLWVAANQADQVVGIDPETGRVVAELGEFLGIRRDGSARGLSFPASLAIVDDDELLVTNLSFVLFGNGSEPEADITAYTVSRIEIPEFGDRHSDRRAR